MVIGLSLDSYPRSTVQRARGAIIALIQLISCLAGSTTAMAALPTAAPEAVGLNGQRLSRIDGIVKEGLEQNKMPGCVVAIGRRGSLAFLRAYGYRQLEPTKDPMTTDTVFDMASITKPVATATSAMILLERGQLRLRNKVSGYIDGFDNGGKEKIYVRQLLTHNAGFIPDNAVGDYDGGSQTALENIYKLKTVYEPGTRFSYSDVGFILLGDLIERQSGQRLNQFVAENIFQPLGMRETGYLPDETLRRRAAVTEQRDGKWMQGEVHDPRAFRMGGVAGHAGLFSTAEDLAIYAQMMLNGGSYQGQRILSTATVKLMTKSYEIVEPRRITLRGLGWDKLSGYSSNRGENFSERAFGHGGFTGTVLWIDPELELFVIFLSNRVHPNGKGSVNALAGRICTVVAAAIDDEAKANVLDLSKNSSRPVRTGLDVLRDDEFRLLQGQRIGLITNQTGIDSRGQSNFRMMCQSAKVNLTALFSPEHGLVGQLDVAQIADTTEDETGLKVFSLYGETRQPTPEHLSQVDTLVFDVQDIGCRFYTYISTMGLAMQAAAEHGKRFVVLDRPNVVNGLDVSGPMLDAGQESFVGFHRLPVRHGMTVGELAMLLRHDLGLDLDLHVVRLENWQRDQFFDETGLPWVNPSPNMRNVNQAILYPGIGLLETTNLSVGRGTDTPFEIVGAPWIDSVALSARLNSLAMAGVQFMPKSFTPKSSVYAKKLCHGVQISITDRGTMEPLEVGLQLAIALRDMHSQQWQVDKYQRLLGNQLVLDAVRRGDDFDAIRNGFRAELDAFRKHRKRFLIYQRRVSP